MKKPIEVTLNKCIQWYAMSEFVQRQWKADSLRDQAFADGVQWTEADRAALLAKNINPLTINRIFSVLQSARGHQTNNRTDMIAKGRTSQDQDMSQIMSQAIEFVHDKNDMDGRISSRFENQITGGIGWLTVGKNPDPVQEPVLIKPLQWDSVGWDPLAIEGPWLKRGGCRYAFYAGWKNVEDVAFAFPKKKREIEDMCSDSGDTNGFSSYGAGSGDFLEEYVSSGGLGGWTLETEDGREHRMKVVDMWYPRREERMFAQLPSGQVLEVHDNWDPAEQFELLEAAERVFNASVTRMRVKSFSGNVELLDAPTPYAHDEFPFVPFVGYLDRYGQPYGIPRNLLESAQELNRRRSMALSLISNRRVIMERTAAKDHNEVYSEANKPDGQVVLEDGKMDKFLIQEMADLSAPQMELMNQAEQEIKEVSGSNDESLGYQTKVQSGVAIEKKKESSVTMLSPIYDNLSRSKRKLSELTIAGIQQNWTGPRMLLVTDSVSGAEKFMSLNEQVKDEKTGQITIQRNITKGQFDIIPDNATNSETERERRSEFFMSAIQVSPPELAGPLITMALEQSNMPNKDQAMRQIRRITQSEPIDSFLTQAELEEKEVEQQKMIDEQQKVEAEKAEQERQLEMDHRRAEIDKIYADIEIAKQTAMTQQAFNADKVSIEKNKQTSEDYLKGVAIANQINRQMSLSQPKVPMSQPQNQRYPMTN